MYVNIGAFLLVIRMNKAFLPAGMWVCINVTDQRSALSQVQFFFFCWSVHVNDRVIISPFSFSLFIFYTGPSRASESAVRQSTFEP